MSTAAPPPGRNAPASRRSNAPAPAAGNRNPAWATSCGARAGTRRCGTAEEAAAVWFIAPSDPRLASAQAAGGGAEDQQAQPVSVRIGKGLPELLAPRRGRRSGNDAGRAFGGRGLWLARWTAVRLTDRRKWGCFSHSCLPRGLMSGPVVLAQLEDVQCAPGFKGGGVRRGGHVSGRRRLGGLTAGVLPCTCQTQGHHLRTVFSQPQTPYGARPCPHPRF